MGVVGMERGHRRRKRWTRWRKRRERRKGCKRRKGLGGPNRMFELLKIYCRLSHTAVLSLS